MDNDPDAHARSASYGGAIFPGSQHFTVAGGTFTTVTKNYTTATNVRSDFRMIPLGEIDLLHEIHLNEKTTVVGRRQSGRPSVRRLYSSRVEGRTLTVAMYQGQSADEEWRQDIASYMSLRHPNLVQICAAASSGDIHATLFYDDLIPFHQFVNLYRHSPILTVYIHGCSDTDFQMANDYTYSAVQLHLHYFECTFWIRPSTGRLCVEFRRSGHRLWLSLELDIPDKGIFSWRDHDTEPKVIDSLTLEVYHDICSADLAQHRTIAAAATVKLGTVIYCDSSDELEGYIEIAALPNVKTDRGNWCSQEAVGEVMEDNWTRFNSDEVSNITIGICASTARNDNPWLAQANQIFTRIHITSNLKDYVLVRGVEFRLKISAPAEHPPPGFLFLCPPEHFRNGPSSFRWPDCSAYWSLDLSGAQRLGGQEAARLGFPSIELEAKLQGWSWDASVYFGLRDFHQGKGFNPDSQDVALHLGYPLYELSNDADLAFAYVNEVQFDEEDRGKEYTDEPEESGWILVN